MLQTIEGYLRVALLTLLLFFIIGLWSSVSSLMIGINNTLNQVNIGLYQTNSLLVNTTGKLQTIQPLIDNIHKTGKVPIHAF